MADENNTQSPELVNDSDKDSCEHYSTVPGQKRRQAITATIKWRQPKRRHIIWSQVKTATTTHNRPVCKL